MKMEHEEKLDILRSYGVWVFCERKKESAESGELLGREQVRLKIWEGNLRWFDNVMLTRTNEDGGRR